MILKTKRLNLRPLEMADWKDLVRNLNNLDISKWLLVVPYPYRKKDALWWIDHCLQQARTRANERKDYNFGIELRQEGIIGGIGIGKIDRFQGTGTIGYWLGTRYHGRGYGSEALEALLQFAFRRLKLRRLEAGVFVGNEPSAGLLEKFGFQREGLKRKAVRCKADDKIKDEYIYGLLKQDYVRPMKKR